MVNQTHFDGCILVDIAYVIRIEEMILRYLATALPLPDTTPPPHLETATHQVGTHPILYLVRIGFEQYPKPN